MKTLSGHSKFILPGRNAAKTLSNGAMLMALKRLGYKGKMTGHGFRAVASTVLNEQGFRPDVIERQPTVRFQEVVHSMQIEEADCDEQQQSSEERMDYHQNARLTLRSREDLARFVLEQGLTRKAAAFRVSLKTVAKWVGRFQRDGPAGLRDRSSRPHRSPRRVLETLQQRVIELRREPSGQSGAGTQHRRHCEAPGMDAGRGRQALRCHAATHE